MVVTLHSTCHTTIRLPCMTVTLKEGRSPVAAFIERLHQPLCSSVVQVKCACKYQCSFPAHIRQVVIAHMTRSLSVEITSLLQEYDIFSSVRCIHLVPEWPASSHHSDSLQMLSTPTSTDGQDTSARATAPNRCRCPAPRHAPASGTHP